MHRPADSRGLLDYIQHRSPLDDPLFEGNTTETTTLVPIITGFADLPSLPDAPMVIPGCAGMVSASNLTALDEPWLGSLIGPGGVKFNPTNADDFSTSHKYVAVAA